MGKRIQQVQLQSLGSETLYLGYVGENEHTQIVVNCAIIFTDYPDATASIVVRPPAGDLYHATITRNANRLIWEITSSDVIRAGSGQAQFTFENDGEVIRSIIARTRIDPSIEATGEAPEPLQNWMDQADAKAAEIAQDAARQAAVDVVEEAEAEIERVAGTIPADYTELSDDVDELKSAIQKSELLLPFAGTWTVGGINSSTGAATVSATRLRSYYFEPKFSEVYCPDGFKYEIAAYEGSTYVGIWNGSGFAKVTNWLFGRQKISEYPTYKYRLILAYTDDAQITLDDSDNIYCVQKTDKYFIHDGKSADAKSVGSVLGSNVNLSLDITQWGRYTVLEQGSLTEAIGTSGYGYVSSTSRIATHPIISLDKVKSITITPDDGYKFLIGVFNEQLTERVYSSGWISTSETFDIAGDIYSDFKNATILLATTNDGTITLNDFDKITIVCEYVDGRIKNIEDKIKDVENVEAAVNSIEEDLQDLHAINLLSEVSWSVGTINPVTGETVTNSTRIRSGYISVDNVDYLKCGINTGYKYGIDWYDSSRNFILDTIGTEWQYKNKIVPIPEGVSYIRLLISDIYDGSASTDFAEEFSCYGEKGIIAELDEVKEQIDDLWPIPLGYGDAFAAKKYFNGHSSDNNLSTLPSLIHISDIHGDAERFDRACLITSKLGADMLVCTGDMVRFNSANNSVYLEGSVSKHNISYIQCMGNHDVYQINTEKEIYEKYVEPFANTLVLPTGISYPTYYYKDIPGKNIRIIAIDQWQVDANSTVHNYGNFHQEQITWFVNTLLATPQDYGIIVAMHTPEVMPVADQTYTKFKQKTLVYAYNFGYTPITEIIDAFISGETISKTFNNKTGASPESFTVNADFSVKNAGVEFIAYMTGHLHSDNITYVQNTNNKQLMLNITCANAWVNRKNNGGTGTSYPNYTELSDLARADHGPCQDAMNLYVIDRESKKIRVVRIGANMPYDLSERRDYMVIPYAD